ncbi:MAG: GNAT family N-acetyltransferase [Candidatus Hydrogenedentes bacterium]|nr:GNAT family N-acetyltransferase [Candidatus Hydrogenedentota bacterium]
MSITVRPYRDEDEAEWLRVHAVIMSISHAWNYCIQERPDYAGYESTRLVAVDGERIVGLTDVQYENEVGELCFQKDSRGGYVLEFGRLPEYGGQEIGKLLMDATIEDAKRLGFGRLEYWSQDRRAQRYYRRLGLKEISRHYRFRFKPPKDVEERMMKDCVGVEYLYGACVPEEWPLVKEKYEIVTKHPLEPHLCVGFDVRF